MSVADTGCRQAFNVVAPNGESVTLYRAEAVYFCPVCGGALAVAPYEPGFGAPSREWCGCCETQFGWDDLVSPLAPPGAQADRWLELRELWLRGGVNADEAGSQLRNLGPV